MGEVMFTTVFLFASAIAAKSGRICTGAPAAATPAGEGAVAPCAACEDGCAFACGSEGLEQPLAMNSAASKETASFIGSLSSNGSGLDGHNRCAVQPPGQEKGDRLLGGLLGEEPRPKGEGNGSADDSRKTRGACLSCNPDSADREAKFLRREDAKRRPRAMPRKLEQCPVLGDQELRPGRERRLEELLVIGIAARGPAGGLAVGQSGFDARR